MLIIFIFVLLLIICYMFIVIDLVSTIFKIVNIDIYNFKMVVKNWFYKQKEIIKGLRTENKRSH